MSVIWTLKNGNEETMLQNRKLFSPKFSTLQHVRINPNGLNSTNKVSLNTFWIFYETFLFELSKEDTA